MSDDELYETDAEIFAADLDVLATSESISDATRERITNAARKLRQLQQWKDDAESYAEDRLTLD